MKLTQAYYQAREDAIKWLNSKERNFSTGLSILINSGYKAQVASKINKWGDKPHSREKLIYELRQMVKVWANPQDDRHIDIDFDEESDSGASAHQTLSEETIVSILKEAEEEKDKEGDEHQLPPVIRKLIYCFAQSYKKRSILHSQLFEIPESNSEENVLKRKAIVEEIAMHSRRMDAFYALRTAYEDSGELPLETELDEILSGKKQQEGQEEKREGIEEKAGETVLPTTLEELKKLRASIAVKLTRARNVLLYSDETKPKDKKENPLIEGARRVRVNKKVAYLKMLIERIDYAIAEKS